VIKLVLFCAFLFCLSVTVVAQTSNDSLLINKATKSNIRNSIVSDSVKNQIKNRDAADSVCDSVNAEYKHYSSEITKATDQYKSKIDSLKSKNLPHDTYSKKLDSLNSLNSFDSWQKKQNALANKPQDKLKSLKTSTQTGVNNKFAVLSKESGGKGNLPPGANIPNIDTGLDKALPDLPKVDNPDLSLPSGKNLNTDLPSGSEIKLPDNVGETVDLGKTPNVNVPKADIPKLDVPKPNVPDVGNITDKATTYTKDIQQVKEGDLSKVDDISQDAAAKAASDEVKVLKDGDKVIADQKAMMESMKNPEEYKKQTLVRAKQMATKQLAAHQEAVQKMVNKASSYQKKTGTLLAKTSDMPKRRDPLKKLKTYERFVPGITLQIQKPGAWLVDFNPSLRYRMTSYWSAGVGWNERFIFGKYDQRDQARMYGVRGFSEVVVFKGWAVRLDAERMSTFVLPATLNQDMGSRQWVWNYMAGVKKEFTFLPKVVGNVQFMYNLYDPGDRMAYANRINVRFGFEFPLRKKSK